MPLSDALVAIPDSSIDRVHGFGAVSHSHDLQQLAYGTTVRDALSLSIATRWHCYVYRQTSTRAFEGSSQSPIPARLHLIRNRRGSRGIMCGGAEKEDTGSAEDRGQCAANTAESALLS